MALVCLDYTSLSVHLCYTCFKENATGFDKCRKKKLILLFDTTAQASATLLLLLLKIFVFLSITVF